MYPLYPSAAAAVEAIQQHQALEWEKAKGLPAWLSFLHAQQIADDKLPSYAKGLMVYRGQSDSSWLLMPTLYRRRRPDDTMGSDLRQREEERARIRASIFGNADIENALPGAGRLSDLQKEAVARHYGAPSSLVDLTCEPEVAAVFATTAKAASDVGYIYAINLVEVLSLAGASLSWGVEGGYQLSLWPIGVSVIHYLEPNPPDPPIEQTATIRFSSEAWKNAQMTFTVVGVPSAARINAQRGIFLSMGDTADGLLARDMWHLVDIVSQRYFFRHSTAGYTPGDPAFREENLLPSDDPLARLVGG